MNKTEYSIRPLLFGVLLAVALGLWAAAGTQAATDITVNTTADTVGDDGACSLREAITAANTDSASGSMAGECAAGSGADTIRFAGNFTVTLSGSQLPTITSKITIIGNGEANTIVQASTCDPVTLPGGCTPANDRLLEVDASGTLTVEAATLRHGYGPFVNSCTNIKCHGAGIYNLGDLTLTEVSLSSNYATRNGGGIYNAGTATLETVTINGNYAGSDGGGVKNNGTITLNDSSLSNNEADNQGGGIRNESGGDVTLTEVVISGNSASASGGGISNSDGNLNLSDVSLANNTADISGGGIVNGGSSSLLLERVTFSDNRADGSGSYGGGGIYIISADPASLTNVSFSGNSAPNGYGGGLAIGGGSNISLINVSFSGNSAPAGQGGGLFNVNGHPTLTNVVIADSPSGGDCIIYDSSSYLNAASSNNLIEDAANACDLVDGVNGNILGADPQLEALADNGGFTQTMALLDGSPAIDTGTNTGCPAQDQREASRPADGDGDGNATCDIGAYEYDGITPATTQAGDSVEASEGNPNANQQLGFGINRFSFGRLYVIVPASAIPDGNANCRIQAELVGSSGEYDFALDDSVWDLNVVCDGRNVTSFQQAITVCIRPTDGVTADKHVFHRHNGGSFSPLPDVAAVSGYACGSTSQLSLFTLGSDTLPATGFAPGVVTRLPEQSVAYQGTEMTLSIPKLGVNADIVGVPKTETGWDVSWLAEDAGYLDGTAFPTLAGNTVITAHVWNADNTAGLFAGLSQLEYGDRFTIIAWDKTYVYEVRSNQRYSPASAAPLAHKDLDWVTLITCESFDEASGQYHYRRAVQAVLINVN